MMRIQPILKNKIMLFSLYARVRLLPSYAKLNQPKTCYKV